MTRQLSAEAEHALERARASWSSSFGTASQAELCRKFERALGLVASFGAAGTISLVELQRRVEHQHRLKYGPENLRAEAEDERARDLAVQDDEALVAYQTKWKRRLVKLQRARPSRWRVPGLSDDELRDELTLRLIDAVRTKPEERGKHQRPGKEWGLLFLAQQRRTLRQELGPELVLDQAIPVLDQPAPSGEEQLIAEQSALLKAMALERAESSLTRPQRRWFAAMKEMANAGAFFESSGRLNLAAVSRLLHKDRSSAKRAFGELRQRVVRELKKLGG